MRSRLITGAALGLLLAACGGGGEAGNGSAAGTEAERRARQGPADAIIVTPEGKAEIRSGGGAMAGLPAGIPPYPGADTTASVQVSGTAPGGSGGILGFRTADPPARVVDFYAAAAERAGYRIAQRMTAGPTAMLTAQRGEGEVLNVTATSAAGAGTQVQIIAGLGRR